MPSGSLIVSKLSELTGDVTLASVARGDLLRRGASAWQNLAVGTAGQVLTVTDIGSGVLEPRWGTAVVTAHSSLSGLTSGDDHTQYLAKSPSTAARNTIEPSADVAPFTLKPRTAGQTANMFEVLSTAGLPMFSLTTAGVLKWAALLEQTFQSGSPVRLYTQHQTSGNSVTLAAMPKGTPTVDFLGMTNIGSMFEAYATDFIADATNYARLIVAAASDRFSIIGHVNGSATARPLVFRMGASTDVLTIHNTGYVMVRIPTSAPTDSNIPTSHAAFYIDEAGAALKIRVRQSDGTTLKTGSVSLT